MEPEGTSRDDLDVRLHWPGGEPERAAEIPSTEPRNGALVEDRATEQLADISSAEPSNRDPDSEALQAALTVISARLDALARRTESLGKAYGDVPAQSAIIATVERLEHSVTVLGEFIAQVDERFDASRHEFDEAFTRIAVGYSENLERLRAATQNRNDELLEHLSELSHQVEALRRRLTLRARADQSLSPEAVELIAEAVVERLSAHDAGPVGGTRSRSGEGARRK